MTRPAFVPLDPQGLEIVTNPRDLLRDLGVYLAYVGEHNIKRVARDNSIPRADLQRLVKDLGGLDYDFNAEESQAVNWIDIVDCLAYQLGLINYDVKGFYRSYSSSDLIFAQTQAISIF